VRPRLPHVRETEATCGARFDRNRAGSRDRRQVMHAAPEPVRAVLSVDPSRDRSQRRLGGRVCRRSTAMPSLLAVTRRSARHLTTLSHRCSNPRGTGGAGSADVRSAHGTQPAGCAWCEAATSSRRDHDARKSARRVRVAMSPRVAGKINERVRDQPEGAFFQPPLATFDLRATADTPEPWRRRAAAASGSPRRTTRAPSAAG
jgi:hypothetical protein